MKTSHVNRTLISVSLSLLLLAGCAGTHPGVSAPTDPAPASSGIAADPFQPAWETQVYEDSYLSYEIPASWQKHASSTDDMRLTLFTEQDPSSETPSNVCVQIMSLQNRSKNLDYADPEIQKLYYEFLVSPEGGLPAEAHDMEYWTEQLGDTWVYSIRFARETDDGTTVQQTGYFPMGLSYSLAVWTTDYSDDCAPPVEEIAAHICETLHIVEP